MASADIEANVHVGLWINWSRGPIMGSTLTLSRDQGNLLIAFTASFIAFVAVHFWHIICAVCHRCYSTPHAKTTIHHQRQIVLRNSPNPEAAFWTVIAMISTWWRHWDRKHTLALLLPLLCLASLSWAAFTIAGGFSSTIASAVGNTVLLNSANCGFPETPADPALVPIGMADTSAAANNAANYAQQCYSANASGTVDCARFVQPKLPWTVDTHAPCPFEEHMCRSKDRNILLDSGPINTNDALGMNTPPNERATIRTTMHCAPLVTEGYSSNYTYEANKTLVRYHYGEHLDTNGTNGLNELPFIHQMPSVDEQYAAIPGGSALGGINYRLMLTACATVDGQPERAGNFFVPMRALQRADADVNMAFLSGEGVIFLDRWDDDWYRGVDEGMGVYSTDAEGMLPTYRPAEAASPLGCIEQWQYCNLGNDGQGQQERCGPLASYRDAITHAGPAFNTTVDAMRLAANGSSPAPQPDQNPQASRLWWLSYTVRSHNVGFYNIVQFLAAKSLASQSGMYSGVQHSLPLGPDQVRWHQDVTNWFAASLANLQAAFVSTPLGSTTADAAVDALRRPATPAEEEAFCGTMKVRSTAYTSFSMFGLCFTWVAGALLVVGSLALEPVLAWMHRRKGRQSYAHLEWTAGGALQLHRLAQEEAGWGWSSPSSSSLDGGNAAVDGGEEGEKENAGGWINCDNEVPITRDGAAVLGGLDMRDPTHPVLTRPGTGAARGHGYGFGYAPEELEAAHHHHHPQQEKSLSSADMSTTTMAMAKYNADRHVEDSHDHQQGNVIFSVRGEHLISPVSPAADHDMAAAAAAAAARAQYDDLESLRTSHESEDRGHGFRFAFQPGR